MTGQFINFYLKYKSPTDVDGLGNAEQADSILTKAKALIGAGQVGVAIIYSANEDQTDSLARAYSHGQYAGNVAGSNQAQVMMAMETKLGEPAWSDLQLKLCIAPITTIPYRSDPMAIVKSDLKRIETYLKNGWAVLGWQNQGTVGNPAHPYAIGGGVVSNMDPKVDHLIQSTLIQFATDYPES